MDAVVVDRIPFRLDRKSFLKSLRMEGSGPYAGEIERLVGEAEAVARPKGVYGSAFVESREGDSVVVEGVTFASRVLRVNLAGTDCVYPFVATCGVELEEWSRAIEGTFHRYCADLIKEAALESAVRALDDHVRETHCPGALSMMNPGSLPDWPVSEQKNLFALFGGAVESIGVYLTEGCVMFPVKSVSGILFPSDEGFESCQLCARQCPKRRAPYEEGLYERKYGR